MSKPRVGCVQIHMDTRTRTVYYSSGTQKEYTPESTPATVRAFLTSPDVIGRRVGIGMLEYIPKAAYNPEKEPTEVPAGSILASDLIQRLQELTKDGDRVVEFYSYEWRDDLEDLEYQPRGFEGIKKDNGNIRILVSR